MREKSVTQTPGGETMKLRIAAFVMAPCAIPANALAQATGAAQKFSRVQ
jgi:hypothetical protein